MEDGFVLKGIRLEDRHSICLMTLPQRSHADAATQPASNIEHFRAPMVNDCTAYRQLPAVARGRSG
jgi:hypothetical protein